MRHANYTIDIDAIAANIKKQAHPLEEPADLDPLLQRIGDARIVMLGEASHGTHEYYTWRSHITKRLIAEKGFNFIVVEGDWPDCYHLNRYIKGHAPAANAGEVLHTFDRWPTWMWANWEISALAQWMKKHNTAISGDKKVGFYGLDVYSLWQSMQEVMEYLRKADPAALTAAEKAYRCFEPL
jgi:erythromycin esterase